MDLAVANASSDSLTIFLGNGNGTFTLKSSAVSGTPDFNFPFCVVAGDFNGDGKLDLAVANGRSKHVDHPAGQRRRNVYRQVFACYRPDPIAIAVADFNGDGRQDLAVANNQSNSVTILLGNGDGTFTADALSPSTGFGAFAVVAADFNGDGRQDLAVANEFSNTVTILLGRGDGTFVATPVSPGTGGAPISLAVGDFNGDGAPDLAVLNFTSFSVTVLLNSGNGTFTPGSTIATGTNPQRIAVGDFNGDGAIDLVVTDATASSLTLLLGNGGGKFEPLSIPLASGTGPIAIAVADFNEDGGPDLAIGDTNSNTVRILLDAGASTATLSNVMVPGSGTHNLQASYVGVPPYLGSTSEPVAVSGTPIPTAVFVAASPSPFVGVGQTVPVTVTVLPVSADNFTLSGTVSLYNGSGLLGGATLTNGQVVLSPSFSAAGIYNLLVKYNGSANFAASSSAVVPVYVDPATATALSVSSNSVASGLPVTLTAAVTTGGKPVTQGLVTFLENSAALATANLTAGGTAAVKLVLGIGTHSIMAVFAGTSGEQGSSSSAQTVTITGLYSTTTALTDSVVSGKYTLSARITGNSTPTPAGSISFVNATSHTTLGTAALGTGVTNLSFTAASPLPVGSGPQAAGVGDFNRDGNLDMAVANATSGTVTILLGNGNGTFTAKSPQAVGGDPTAVAVGDFNGDGIPDLAVANFASNSVAILLGNGDGTFTTKSPLPTGTAPIGVAVGDFNLDGKLDLAVTNNNSSDVTILLGNGDGTFTAAPTLTGFSVPRGVVVGDFNGDGRPDLAVTNFFGQSVAILLGNGNGTFVQSATVPTGALPWPVVAGDFNGDGKLDLAVANSGDGSLTVFVGNGNGTFGAPATIPLGSGSQPQGLVAGDFNHDHKLDLAVAEFNSNQAVILLGNGNGAFTLEPTAIATGSQPWSIVAGDFNDDGRLDLVVPNNGSNNVSVLLNSLGTTVTATLSGVSISGSGSQSVVATYPGSTVYAASTSNTLSLRPTP